MVVQWLRICLPMQGTQVQSLVRELRSHMVPLRPDEDISINKYFLKGKKKNLLTNSHLEKLKGTQQVPVVACIVPPPKCVHDCRSFSFCTRWAAPPQRRYWFLCWSCSPPTHFYFRHNQNKPTYLVLSPQKAKKQLSNCPPTIKQISYYFQIKS